MQNLLDSDRTSRKDAVEPGAVECDAASAWVVVACNH